MILLVGTKTNIYCYIKKERYNDWKFNKFGGENGRPDLRSPKNYHKKELKDVHTKTHKLSKVKDNIKKYKCEINYIKCAEGRSKRLELED